MKKNQTPAVFSAIRRHRAWIGRGVALALAVVLLTLTGIGAAGVVQNDRLRAQGSDEETVSPIRANRNRDYGTGGLHTVAETDRFVLQADTANGELCVLDRQTNTAWYSNPQDRDSDSIAPVKSRLSSQLVLTVLDVETGATATADTANASLRVGGMDVAEIQDGLRFTFSFPTYGIRIPVRYTLTENGLCATLEADGIEELWTEKYLLQDVSLLPFFGAGGLSDEGYMVVPDGSGAVMEFNNRKERFDVYSQRVYGANAMVVQDTAPDATQTACMPVFGIRKNGQGFAAVITAGDADAVIYATVSRKVSAYNQVYAKLQYRNSAFYAVSGSSSGLMDAGAPLLQNSNFSVEYRFLSADAVDYTGMANSYRAYLLEKRQSSAAAQSALALDAYGGVLMEKYVFGVKRDVVIPLTTYESLATVLQDSRAAGLKDTVVRYIGAQQGGTRESIVTRFSAAKALGSKQALQALLQTAEDTGSALYFGWDPLDIYRNGHGYRTSDHSVKTFFGGYSYQYEYKQNTGLADMSSRWFLLKPQLLPKLADGYFRSQQAFGSNKIAVDRLGSLLYSDYDTDQGLLSSGVTMALWQQTLESLRTAGGEVLLNGANAYVYPYADRVTDVPLTDSGFDMTDYSVPFMQIALRGVVPSYSGALNVSADHEELFLLAAEGGCGIRYAVLTGDVSTLINSTHSELVACDYARWQDVIYSQAAALQALLDRVKGQPIVRHSRLTDTVTLTEYGNGVRVYVNHGSEDYTADGRTVPAGQFVTEGGDAQ